MRRRGPALFAKRGRVQGLPRPQWMEGLQHPCLQKRERPGVAVDPGQMCIRDRLYEGLTAVGGDYAVRLNLAASIDEGEPLRPVVAIRSDAHFSDGSPVTAADIAASFSAAKGTAAFGPLLTLSLIHISRPA